MTYFPPAFTTVAPAGIERPSFSPSRDAISFDHNRQVRLHASRADVDDSDVGQDQGGQGGQGGLRGRRGGASEDEKNLTDPLHIHSLALPGSSFHGNDSDTAERSASAAPPCLAAKIAAVKSPPMTAKAAIPMSCTQSVISVGL